MQDNLTYDVGETVNLKIGHHRWEPALVVDVNDSKRSLRVNFNSSGSFHHAWISQQAPGLLKIDKSSPHTLPFRLNDLVVHKHVSTGRWLRARVVQIDFRKREVLLEYEPPPVGRKPRGLLDRQIVPFKEQSLIRLQGSRSSTTENVLFSSSTSSHPSSPRANGTTITKATKAEDKNASSGKVIHSAAPATASSMLASGQFSSSPVVAAPVAAPGPIASATTDITLPGPVSSNQYVAILDRSGENFGQMVLEMVDDTSTYDFRIILHHTLEPKQEHVESLDDDRSAVPQPSTAVPLRHPVFTRAESDSDRPWANPSSIPTDTSFVGSTVAALCSLASANMASETYSLTSEPARDKSSGVLLSNPAHGDAYGAAHMVPEPAEVFDNLMDESRELSTLTSTAATSSEGLSGIECDVASSSTIVSSSQPADVSAPCSPALTFSRTPGPMLSSVDGDGSQKGITYVWHLHSFVLAFSSPVFHKIISSNMVERSARHITIEGFDPQVVSDTLYALYGGAIAVSSWSHAVSLIEFAHLYCLDALKKALEEKLLGFVQLDNFIVTYLFAKHYQLDVLKDVVVQAMRAGAQEVLSHASFVRLPPEDVQYIFLEAEEVHVPDETVLFLALHEWSAHHVIQCKSSEPSSPPEQRDCPSPPHQHCCHLEQLFRKIRYHCIPEAALRMGTSSPFHIVRKILLEALSKRLSARLLHAVRRDQSAMICRVCRQEYGCCVSLVKCDPQHVVGPLHEWDHGGNDHPRNY